MGIELIKKSTLKAVLATSIIFLGVIALVVWFFDGQIKKLEDERERKVVRIIAKDDIVPGTSLTIDTIQLADGTVIPANVEAKAEQDVVDMENFLYKLRKNSKEDEEGKTIKKQEDLAKAQADGLWAEDKVAVQPIAKGEWITLDKVTTYEEYHNNNDYLYPVKFDSYTTGGYNVNYGEYVDIMIKYDTDVNVNDVSLNATKREIFKSLHPNQMVDVVLAKKLIEDVRDETGISITQNSATKPGYICFNLTAEEINKIEWAQECGTLYIGKKTTSYSEEATAETFMQGMEIPSIGGIVKTASQPTTTIPPVAPVQP